MSETKFTPGPWWVGRKDNPIGYFPIYARAGATKLSCVAKTDAHEVGFGISEAEQRANAHLIKASPKMYELLAVILANAEIIPDPRMGGATDCYAVPLDDIEDIRALLPEARGEQTDKEN